MFGEYLSFINTIPEQSKLYIGQYNYSLVILSIVIAMFASYTALSVAQFTEQVSEKRKRLFLLPLAGSH